MAYRFTFDKLTIGDFQDLSSGNNDRMLSAVDRLTTGGVLRLPLHEMPVVINQFVREYTEHVEAMGGVGKNESDLRDMLKGVKGLDDE